jgi:hypothetical protein
MGNYNEMMALGMNPASPEKRRMSNMTMIRQTSGLKSSFSGGNPGDF